MSNQKSSIKTFLKKYLPSTDSNWNANTCRKYGNSSQHSYSIFHGNSNPELVSCTPQGSYERNFQYSSFSNSKSGTSFSDTGLIFLVPVKVFLLVRSLILLNLLKDQLCFILNYMIILTEIMLLTVTLDYLLQKLWM